MLYKDSNENNLDLNEIKNFIKNTFPFTDIVIRRRFINFHTKNRSLEDIAKELASIKVKDIYKPFLEYPPLIGEIEFEKKRLLEENKLNRGILYDGLKLMLLYWQLLPKNEKISNFLHIVITDRLFGTFLKVDGRFHIRSILCSRLSLISTSGIVEGPARPRLFYKLKHQSSIFGMKMPIEMLKEHFKGQFIDYDDPNMTEVLKGYVSQAIFFNLTGDAFCQNKECRLFNAHWQSELINSQLIHKNFCEEHTRMLEKLKMKY
ncbi:MAG: DUF6775 family putative metallopeptidase [Candidatus Helarchaeota archaeon]